MKTLSTETLKKLGILGVSFGLLASPLTFADFHEEEDPQEEEETLPDTSGNAEADRSFDTLEYENEEEEYEYEEEDEEEEEEWEEEEEDDDQGW